MMNLLSRITIQKALRDLRTALVVAGVLVSSLFPGQALAFEANVSADTAALLAPVSIAGRDVSLIPSISAPATYGYRDAGLAVAPAIPITERAVWPEFVPVSTAGTGLVLEGEASFYSRAGCLGCNPLRIMANGEQLNDSALTMAIGADKKHLVGYHARVTSLATGQSTVVRITDTGGFYKEKYGNRVADLTIATKQAIGMAGGVGQVRVEIL